MAKKTYNRNVIAELLNRGYHNRHIAIILGAHEKTIARISKEKDDVEPTLQFMTKQQKQRMYVLDKLLALKPVAPKWCSNNYYYITILKFLLIPYDTVMSIYRAAPQKQKALAYKENSPHLKDFDYTCLGINSEEWELFAIECYKILNNPDKWK